MKGDQSGARARASSFRSSNRASEIVPVTVSNVSYSSYPMGPVESTSIKSLGFEIA